MSGERALKDPTPAVDMLLERITDYEKRNGRSPEKLYVTHKEWLNLRTEVWDLTAHMAFGPSIVGWDPTQEGFAGTFFGVKVYVKEPDRLIVRAQELVDKGEQLDG